MDAATISAVAAAIPPPVASRSTASAALAIALDISRTRLRTLKTLATALPTALGLGGYLPALISAGERMIVYNDITKEYGAAFEAAMENKNDDHLQHHLHTMEIAMQLAAEENACQEYGHLQMAMSRKLDYVNAFGPRLRIFPVCTAKSALNTSTNQRPSCGIALPSRLWTQPDPKILKFVCEVNWSALTRELQRLPDHDPLHKWAAKMHLDYGSIHSWPDIGCGASFYPNMEGGTMVAEVQCEDGTWEAFSTDPFPMEIADEVKQVLANDYLPSPGPDPDHLRRDIPFSPPMTHHHQGLPIIARYPLEVWESTNRPSLTAKGWCKLAMIISTRGMTNIQSCFEATRRL